jgi:transcription antitermination factor NusG
MRWYVLCTKSNYEKQAEQNIRRMGVECFLPLLQERRTIRRKVRAVVALSSQDIYSSELIYRNTIEQCLMPEEFGKSWSLVRLQ